MGVHVLRDSDSGYSCLYCSTTMLAFGGVFQSDEDADEFLTWLEETYGKDPRQFSGDDLQNKIHEWRKVLEEDNK